MAVCRPQLALPARVVVGRGWGRARAVCCVAGGGTRVPSLATRGFDNQFGGRAAGADIVQRLQVGDKITSIDIAAQ